MGLPPLLFAACRTFDGVLATVADGSRLLSGRRTSIDPYPDLASRAGRAPHDHRTDQGGSGSRQRITLL
ncbi:MULTISPECIES: hypothetical protein [Saccharopolyspora]|uniref:Uncharacterized protein n=1 Tax=Saccharopolyspora cebuensis TaxID=418759 RepID=A0ABV4CLR2_9PSEU